MSKRICVVPTCRPDGISNWLKTWEPYDWWDDLIIVHDSPAVPSEFVKSSTATHVSWAEMVPFEEAHGMIFSRRDSAVRSFGFFIAAQRGADLILTLDDDCLPHTQQGHEHYMSVPRWASSVPGHRMRGMPYYNTPTFKSQLNVGLWTNVPDQDGIMQLSAPWKVTEEALPLRAAVPLHQYVPMCGMNLAFVRDMLPAMLFAPMGEGLAYRRFDDIWCGVIVKRVMDVLGLTMSYGLPYVEHSRASNPFVNLIKESVGLERNETFFEVLQDVDFKDLDPTVRSAMWRVARHFASLNDSYLLAYSERLTSWLNLVEYC